MKIKIIILYFYLICWLGTIFLQANNRLVLPPNQGQLLQVIGLADSVGDLTWLTTATNSVQINSLYTGTSAALPLTLVLRDSTASFAVDNLIITGTETIARNLLVTGSIIGSVLYEYPATTAIARTVQNKLNDSINITDFGAVGDGVTNDFGAFQQAFAYLTLIGGGRLYIPSGTYMLGYSGNNVLSLPANTLITGDGSSNTILNLAATPSTAVFFRNTVSNVMLQQLALVVNPAFIAPSQTLGIIGMTITCNNFTMTDVEFNGNMTNTGSTLPYIAHGIEFPSGLGTQNNIIVNRCSFHNLDFPFLKASSALSTQVSVFVMNSNFYNNYATDIAFNNTSGMLLDLTLSNNTITQNLAYLVGLSNGIGISLVGGISNLLIVNNYASGIFNNAISLAGNISNFVIKDNVFEVDGWGITLSAIESGTLFTLPQNGVIKGNALTLTGTTVASPRAISPKFTTTPMPAENFIIKNNVISGKYYIGIEDGAYIPDIGVISGNLVSGAITGYNLVQGGFYCDKNISSNCNVGLQGVIGSVNRHIFHDCIVTATSAFSGPLVILNPIVEFDTQALLATGTTLFPLFRTNNVDRLAANAKLYVRSTDPASINDFSANMASIAWTGNTFTSAPLITLEPGSYISTFTIANGMLALQVYSSVATTSVVMEVSLDGMYAMY